jgi:hypothetical protein
VSGPLDRLADALRAEGGLLAETVGDPGSASHDARVDPERTFAIEAIREGHLLHGPGGRVVRTDDPDLALLAGDRLYALGLAELAAAGDLEAVRAMAEAIAGAATARGAGDDAEAEAAWDRGVCAITQRPSNGDR